MFFDWLRMYQDFSEPLPVVGDRLSCEIDALTGEHLSTSQRPFKHEGSYSTSIVVRIRGNRIIVDGNPSRYGRPENLFGFETIDKCVAVYNRILKSYGLPEFTKCTKLDWLQGEDGKKASRCSDGAVIQELHITSNWAVGQGNVLDFIKAISTQPYRQMVPRLHTNGQTTDWLTKSCKGSDLIYPTCYNKAHDLETKALKKIEKKYGVESPEYSYIKNVVDYCKSNGVIRFEQKLKRLFLQQNNLQFWGIDDFTPLKPLHDEFVNLKDKMQVEAMDFENISQQLINSGVCDNTRSANTTAMYAINWMHGQKFDFGKTQVQTHRARLRKIGIDIAYACDISKFSVVVAKNARVITMDDLPVPTWYQPATVEGVRAA